MQINIQLSMAEEIDGGDLQVTLKSGTGETYSFMSIFSSGVTEYSRPEYEIKEPYKNEWPDEDGDDVYIGANGLKLKGADLTVSLCYVGKKGGWSSTCHGIINTLRTAGLVDVLDPYSSTVYHDCYFVSLTDIEVYSEKTAGDIVTYKVKFHITSPKE